MNRILLAMCSLGAAAGALTGCDADGNRKGLVVTPGMVDSIPYDAYDENPFGGQTLRLAPKGTVPYGGKRYFYGPTPEEGVRAGAELQNPIEPTAENLARGKDRYETFCLVCHGASGAGHGPIIGPLPKRIPAPPPYDVRAKGLPDGHLFHIMTYGQGSMASYAVQVQQDDRWRIIHYIRTLQGIAPGSVPPGIPAATSGAGGQGGAGGGEGGAGGEGGQGGAGDQGGGGHGGAGGNAGDQGGAGGDEPWEFDNLPRPPPLPDAPEPPRPAPKPAPKPLPKPGPAPKPPAGDPYD